MTLNDVPLVDMYLGEFRGAPFCDIKPLPGADSPREALPESCFAEVMKIRDECERRYFGAKRPEFAYLHQGVTYRVTVFEIADGGRPFFTFSRVAAKIYPIDRLGLPDDIEDLLVSPSLRGLVVVVGGMGSGKTSSSQSMVSHRLTRRGGIALAMEDPIETVLEGMHGPGRCIQVEVSRSEGGYGEALTRALRSRMGTLFVGEIRDADTALRVLTMASTDHLIFSTLHAASPAAAFELLDTYATDAKGSSASGLVSRAVSVVIYQSITRSRDGASTFNSEAVSLLDIKDSAVIRTMIERREYATLSSQFSAQHKRRLHGS